MTGQGTADVNRSNKPQLPLTAMKNDTKKNTAQGLKDVVSLISSGQVELLPVFDLFPLGVTIVDANGYIVYCNSAQAKIDGVRHADAVGKYLGDVYTAGKPLETSVILSCLQTGKPIINRTSLHRTRFGKLVNAQHHAFPLYTEGKIAGVILFLEPFSNRQVDCLQSQIQAQPQDRVSFDSIVGGNAMFRRAVNIARTAAAGPSPILICGSTGTGKELFARGIHEASPWSSGPYMTVNCAAIPATLLEGILFGTSKGAFTGALDKKGLFEEANNGVLYLDELDSMPLELQAKLLRTLQERKVRRVGSTQERPFNVKLVCSISDKPDVILEQKRLRPDVFYRVAVAQVELPCLRERLDDLEDLCRFFLLRHNNLLQREVMGISQQTMELFRQYGWPGNVRELEHIIEGALNLASGYDMLEPDLLPDYFFRELGQHHSENTGQPQKATWSEIQDTEKQALETALQKSGGNLSRAAGLLGISRQLVAYHMRKCGLKREDYFFQ